MTKEFIPYEEALALKELGFDEPCMSSRDMNNGEGLIQLPLYQQAFRWFREKYDLDVISRPHIGKSKKYVCDPINFRLEAKNTLEEAELECIKNLIEIVKQKKL